MDQLYLFVLQACILTLGYQINGVVPQNQIKPLNGQLSQIGYGILG